MSEIFTTASGFFIIIFIGYLLKKLKIVKLEDKDFLGKILLNVCLPAVIVMSFQDFTYDSSLLIAVVIGCACNLTGIFAGYMVSRKQSRENKAMMMMLTGGYNIGIFTIPFVSTFFTSSAVLAVLMFDVGNAVFVMGISAAIVNGILNNEKGNPIPSILEKMSKSVTILTYVAMFILVGLGIKLPDSFFGVVSIASNATSFLAMIMVGIMLEFKINPSEKKELFTLLGLRYGFAFTLAFLLYHFLPLELDLRKAMMIGVLSPMSTATMVFAQTFGCKPSLLGGAGTFSILLSMIFIVLTSALVGGSPI